MFKTAMSFILSLTYNSSMSIYKAYDIRGIYPQEIDEQTTEVIARACLLYLKETNSFSSGNKVFVGRDVRNSSPALTDVLINTLLEAGVNVDFGGIITTDLLYFAVGMGNYAGGIMVTASHNPSEYNGFKFVSRGVKFVSGTEIEESVKKLDGSGRVVIAEDGGQRQEVDILEDFIQYIWQQAGVDHVQKKFKAILDPGNGSVGAAIPLAAPRFGLDFEVINERQDGNFPGRGPNPQTNIGDLPERVVKSQADFGIAWDNDGDRIFFVDDLGRVVEGDQTTAVVAQYLLKQHPGGIVVHDAVSSQSIKEVAEEIGGQAIISPVGSVFVKRAMEKYRAILGGEISAHIFYPFSANNYTWYAECTWLTVAYVLRALDESGRKLSELIDEVTRYKKAGPIVFETTLPTPVLQVLAAKYEDGAHDALDGLTVKYPDWWFNVRLSNTEPILKMVIEAKTPELLQQKKEELESFINTQLGHQ